LNTCPIYQRVGGHAYGSVYSGPIGAVITPLLQDVEVAKDLPYGSSLCGACSGICPVKIDIHHMLLWLRQQVVTNRHTPWQERLAMKLFVAGMSDSALYRLGSGALRLALRLGGRQGRPLKVPGWTQSRDFPPLAERSFKTLWKELEKTEAARTHR
jgi:L-lactate dehydrogenase complex protein LldF